MGSGDCCYFLFFQGVINACSDCERGGNGGSGSKPRAPRDTRVFSHSF